MAITIETHTTSGAPIILIYGPEGCGKTSLALDAPNPIYLQIAPEAPPWGKHPKKFAGVSSFSDVMSALRMLYKTPGDFQTLVIDSLSSLEPWVWEAVCLKNNWKDIEAPGFGRGYVAVDYLWVDLYAGLRKLGEARGITTLLIAHSEGSYVDEPGLPPFHKHTIRLHKRGEAIATESCDAIWFMHTKVTMKTVDTGFGRKENYAEGGGVRMLSTDGRAHFMAKNRFNMPTDIIIPMNQPWDAVANYLIPPESPIEPEPEKITATLEPVSVAAPSVVPPPSPTGVENKAVTNGLPKMSELIAKYEPQVNPPSTVEEMSAGIGGDMIPL